MKKESMNPSSREQVEAGTMNVVSLFGETGHEVIVNDPLSDLIQEAMVEDAPMEPERISTRKLVDEKQFPDQAIFVLEDQLRNLKSTLNRMKYYLGDLEDLLPSKNS